MMGKEYPVMVPGDLPDTASPGTTVLRKINQHLVVCVTTQGEVSIGRLVGDDCEPGPSVSLDNAELEALVEFIHRETNGMTKLVDRIIREAVALDHLTEELQEEG